MRNCVGALLMGAALLAPVGVKAYDHDRDDHRYYDADRRDWHEWNDREDRAYRRYLEERHEQYHDWRRANRKEQRDYWRWRHSHPDEMLWRDHDRH